MANPIEDAAKSGEGLLSRINHPIFGAFLGSWLVWNWRIIYLLICGFKNPEMTIDEVSKQYLFSDDFLGPHLKWNTVFLFPLYSTIFILAAGPVLHDGYLLFKKWINAWINKVEPIPKSIYVRMDYEKTRAIQERTVIQAAYNLTRNRSIDIPGTGGELGIPQQIEANQLVENYFNNQNDVEVMRQENNQLKADLLEAKNEIEKLRKTR